MNLTTKKISAVLFCGGVSVLVAATILTHRQGIALQSITLNGDNAYDVQKVADFNTSCFSSDQTHDDQTFADQTHDDQSDHVGEKLAALGSSLAPLPKMNLASR